jgi:tRNA pseudouridine38-40 synthase
MRIRLVIEYDGSAYSGWQLQAGDDTVQARIEAVLEKLFGQRLRVRASGRTDAGVHARGQVAAFDAPGHINPRELRRTFNAMLPADIVVREAAEAPPDFDPRRAAVVRVYEYYVRNQELRSAFEHRYAWHIAQPLNFAAMGEAARVFHGRHDFAAFRTLGTETKSTVRDIHLSQWQRRCDYLVYRVEGSSFLRHMVRSMVAGMVEVGRNRLTLKALRALLDGGERSRAPAAAPACGLFLVEVRYPQGFAHSRS